MKLIFALHKNLPRCHILVLLALLPAMVLADSYRSETEHNFTDLVPVNVPAPPTPGNRIGPGPEGWVTLRFSVNADGSTSNVEVLDSMPSNFSTRDTVSAVEAWTFEPATVEGEAVDWHNNIVTVEYDLEEIPNISGPQFTQPYAQVQEYLEEERFDRAANRGYRNLREGAYTLHDIGMGNVQLSIVEMRREDMHLALQAISRATPEEISQLTDEELDVALQYRFNIELALGRYVDAMETFERRQAIADIPEDDVMHGQVAQIEQALGGGYTLNAMGKILDRGAGWFYIPSRRTFTVANVDGKVDSIEATCNRRIITVEYQPEVEWSLPESWGDCSIKVMGGKNTTFTFFEFAPQ